MASLIPGYEYDIFISYRQKDNKGDRWVSNFVDALKSELDPTFKEDVSVYFDINPHDGLLETHDVGASLKEKLRCLIFIPVISRTYCDPKSFAWEHEFIAFVEQASKDQFGMKVKLPGGNVANRVLPVRIHDLDIEDLTLCESVLGGVLRGIEFIYKEPGVNRPLTPDDNDKINLNATRYRNQINKIALGIRDIIQGMKTPLPIDQAASTETLADTDEQQGRNKPDEEKLHNLPVASTSFVGREKEIMEVRDILLQNRLVTLTGSGGCGKTRLSQEIALSLLEDYKDGVWFIDLAPITDPNLVAKEIIQVLKIQEESDKAIVDTLVENIKNRSLMILLDNCEHLIQACAEIADKLLRSVRNLRILSTSREALNISGEVVWRIPSLSCPDPDSEKDIIKVQKYEAIRLFVERAASGKPGFTLNPQNVSPIVQICRRFEGIPLAIELAATRIRHMGPEIILERLEDQFRILYSASRTAPARQQTLKAAIDWSYTLLSEQEQILFNRLSVFAGNFSLEAVEDVCSDKELDMESILPLLSQLVDKSLVIADNQEDESVRYRCLMPLQQYGLQKMIERGEEEKIRQKHLSCYLKLAEKAYDEQFELQHKWMNKLELEHDNILSALYWTDKHLPDGFVKLTGTLAWFWRGHTYIFIGKDYLERALLKDIGKAQPHARALIGLGMIINYTRERPRAIILMIESLKIFRQYNNLWEEANVLATLSANQVSDGDYENGLKGAYQSLNIARKIDKPGLINHCLLCVCQGLVHSKQYKLGDQLAEELLISSEKLNHLWGIEMARHFLGDCALGNKNFSEAERKYSLGVVTGLKYGTVFLAAADLEGVAFSLSGQSRWAKCIRLDAAAWKKSAELGVSLSGVAEFWDEWIDIYIVGAKKKLGEELTRKHEEEGRNMGFEAAVEYALDFDKD
jgi:predicted ATPase